MRGIDHSRPSGAGEPSCSEKWLGWHFLTKDGLTAYGHLKPMPGEILHCGGDLELFSNGLHACKDAIEAIGFAQGPIVERVELLGERVDGTRMSCARSRKCLWIADASSELHNFALWCVEYASRYLESPDAEVAAVENTMRAWLQGRVTDKEVLNARKRALAVSDQHQFEAYSLTSTGNAKEEEWGLKHHIRSEVLRCAACACELTSPETAAANAVLYVKLAYHWHNKLMGYDSVDPERRFPDYPGLDLNTELTARLTALGPPEGSTEGFARARQQGRMLSEDAKQAFQTSPSWEDVPG